MSSKSRPRVSKSVLAQTSFKICGICNQPVYRFSKKDTWEVTLRRHRAISKTCGIMIHEDVGEHILHERGMSPVTDDDSSDEEAIETENVLLSAQDIGMNVDMSKRTDFILSEMDVDDLCKEGRFKSIEIDAVIPNSDILDRQTKLEAFFDSRLNPKPFGNLRSPTGKTELQFKWEDDADLLKLATFCGMSDNQGDVMIETFQKILDRWDVRIPIHKDFSYMRSKLDRMVSDHFAIETKHFPFNKEIFGETVRGQPMKPMIGTNFDIKSVLAEALLECEPSQFLTEFQGENPPPGISANFGNSPMWKAICDDMNQYPEINGQCPIPICLVISSDEAMASRSKSEQPLDFGILNCVGSSFKKHLVGYNPLNLPYSEATLIQLLKDRGIIFKTDHERILRWTKRKAMLDFIFSAFDPVTRLGENCFEVLIGQGAEQIKRIAFIHVLLISGDGMFLDGIAGTGMRRLGMQCRLCTTRKLYGLTEPVGGYVYRDDFEHAWIVAQLEEVYLKRWRWFVNKGVEEGTIYKFSLQDKEFIKLGKHYGLVEGRNCLYKFFSYWRGRGISSLHQAVPPDFLHVIEKGLLEKTIQWTLVVIALVEELSRKNRIDNYTEASSLLDARIISFPPRQSYWFSRFTRHTQGVSGLVKVAMANKKRTTHQTGLMSGSLEAWKMLDLVIQIMFCIGDTGDVLPNSGVWFSRITGLQPDHICANIGMVVIQACASAVEMAKFLRSGHYTPQDKNLCLYLEKIGRFHHARLAMLKKILSSVCTGVQFDSITLQNCISGNKFHYYEHIRLAREIYGVDIRIFDTESSEKLHQFSVVIPHRKGSKRIAGKQRNMLRYYKRGLFIDKFGKSELKEVEKPLRCDEDIGRAFTALGSYKYNQLYYDDSLKRWSFMPGLSEFYFHPFMTMKQLASSISDIKADYACSDDARFSIYLMEKISCKEDTGEDWNIYCTQHYNASQFVPGTKVEDLMKTWSVVTAVVNGKDGLIMHCLVLAILFVECELSDGLFNSFHLVVSPLEFREDVGMLPYDYVKHCLDDSGHLVMFTISCKDDVIDGAFAVPVIRGLSGDYNSDIENLEYKDRTFIVVAKSRFTFPRDHLLTPALYNEEYPHFFHTEVEIEDTILQNDMHRPLEDTIDVHVEDSSVHSDISSADSVEDNII